MENMQEAQQGSIFSDINSFDAITDLKRNSDTKDLY